MARHSRTSTIEKTTRKIKKASEPVIAKKNGSKNRTKAKKRIAKLHYKVASIRSDSLHKLTTQLTKNYRNIVIEDLDISRMVKQKRLSRSIMDGGWHEFRRQLNYKAQLRGNKIFIADKWYASSKRCSSCGHHKEDLTLSERIYKCSNCELK